jgi:uncharacterized membrane protein
MADLLIISVHIPAGLTAIVAGIVAMLARKGEMRHRAAGRVYLWSISFLGASALGLVATRGPQFAHLLLLGAVAVSLAFGGFAMRRNRPPLHIAGMGLSYIAMLTAFYVDNGPKLPFWNLLPEIAFWIGPFLIGWPIIIWAMRRRGFRCLA